MTEGTLMTRKASKASTTAGRNRAPRRQVVSVLCVGLVVLLVQIRGGAQVINRDPIPFDRGLLITGNYVAGGVDLTPQANPPDANGIATGTISFNSTLGNAVPNGAIIVGAYLFWESIHGPGAHPTQGANFRGTLIDPNVNWP